MSEVRSGQIRSGRLGRCRRWKATWKVHVRRYLGVGGSCN